MKPAKLPSDSEIEAIVAEAIAAEASAAQREAAPPSSAIVWWRAQMRARQEAARAVDRPLTIVHGVAIACAIGLLVSMAETVIAGVKGSTGWLSNVYATVASVGSQFAVGDAIGRFAGVPLTLVMVMAATLVIASVTAYVIFVDE